MKLAIIATIIMGIFCCLTSVQADDTTAYSITDKLSIGYEASGIREKKMDQSDGLKPEYTKYRIDSDRWFVVVTYDILDQLAVQAKLGSADLETHSNEGETVEFDASFAWGIGVQGTIAESADKTCRFNAGMSYLTFEPDDGTTTRIPKDSLSTGGDLSVEWAEFELTAEVEKDYENFTGTAGIRYLNVSADQDRVYPTNTVSSSFDADNEVGLYAGLDIDLSESLALGLQVNFIDERKFTMGLTYTF